MPGYISLHKRWIYRSIFAQVYPFTLAQMAIGCFFLIGIGAVVSGHSHKQTPFRGCGHPLIEAGFTLALLMMDGAGGGIMNKGNGGFAEVKPAQPADGSNKTGWWILHDKRCAVMSQIYRRA